MRLQENKYNPEHTNNQKVMRQHSKLRILYEFRRYPEEKSRDGRVEQ